VPSIFSVVLDRFEDFLSSHKRIFFDISLKYFVVVMLGL